MIWQRDDFTTEAPAILSITVAGTALMMVPKAIADGPEEMELVALQWQSFGLVVSRLCVGQNLGSECNCRILLGSQETSFSLWVLSPTNYIALGNLSIMQGSNFHIAKVKVLK